MTNIPNDDEMFDDMEQQDPKELEDEPLELDDDDMEQLWGDAGDEDEEEDKE